MNVIDWMLLILVAAYALSGYWQGFVTGAFATAGLLIGGAIGIIWLAPFALGNAESALWVSLAALFIVILSATLGQAFLQYGGARIRERITWQPVRAVDAVGGAVLSSVAVLLVAWALGVAITGSRIGSVTQEVRNSYILGKVDQALPNGAYQLLGEFNNVVGTDFFPRYLEPFAPERIIEVKPPDRKILRDPDVVNAASGVLKIRGTNDCGRGVEGTGFLYSPTRLMTNAHVVAGVDDPEVVVGEETLDADVVYYNEDLDVAVLRVANTNRRPLTFAAEEGQAQQAVALLGYPEDGPYDAEAARIRALQRLRSQDIYGDGSVLRDVFSLRGQIRPGNSGGPLVNSQGEVIGVIFAASVTDEDTGYALNAASDALGSAAANGLSNNNEVSTGDCAG